MITSTPFGLPQIFALEEEEEEQQQGRGRSGSRWDLDPDGTWVVRVAINPASDNDN